MPSAEIELEIVMRGNLQNQRTSLPAIQATHCFPLNVFIASSKPVISSIATSTAFWSSSFDPLSCINRMTSLPNWTAMGCGEIRFVSQANVSMSTPSDFADIQSTCVLMKNPNGRVSQINRLSNWISRNALIRS